MVTRNLAVLGMSVIVLLAGIALILFGMSQGTESRALAKAPVSPTPSKATYLPPSDIGTVTAPIPTSQYWDPPTPAPASPHTSTPGLYTGNYFTMQIPPEWGKPQIDDAGGRRNVSLQSVQWYLGSILESVYVRVLNRPYAEEADSLCCNPKLEEFRAGPLVGRIATFPNDAPATTVVILPSTSSGMEPIYYQASLLLPASLTAEQREHEIKQVRDAVATLVPTQFALMSTPTAAPPPAGLLPCPADSLTATGDGQGAGGSFYGSISLTNKGETICIVKGRPRFIIVQSDGKTAPLKELSLPLASGNPDTVIVLEPGKHAAVGYISRRTCVPRGQTYSYQLEMLDTQGQINVEGPIGGGRCEEPGKYPSSIEVGTWDQSP